MGCSGSSHVDERAMAKAPRAEYPITLGKAAGKGGDSVEKSPAKGKGKGRGKGKGKGKGKANLIKGKFQTQLEGKWNDYGAEEDTILRRAFLVGQPNAKFHLRGYDYEYDFKRMEQKNLNSGRSRQIRAPMGMVPPSQPLLPPGCMIVIAVPENAESIEIADPNNPGRKLQVAVPPGSKPGAKMAVPVPAKGEKVEDVVARQRGWSAGAKTAAAAAAVGALAVGGVVLGEHLSDGAVSTWAAGAVDDAGAALADGAEAVADWAPGAGADAGEAVGHAAAAVADWAPTAGADAGAWASDAAEDVGIWLEGAGDDAGDWLTGAAADLEEFVTTLF